MVKNIWLVLVLVLLPQAAAAENLRLLGTLTRKSNANSTWDIVVKKSGCHPGWVSQALSDSGLEHSDPLRLPVGQKIYLRVESCKKAPSKEAERMRVQMMNLENELDRVEKELSELKNASAERDSVILQTAAEREGLKQKLAELESERGRSYSASVVASTGIGGLLSGAVIALVLARRREKGGAFLKPITLTEEGEKYFFRLVGGRLSPSGNGELISLHECPLCGENRLWGTDRNLREHLTTKCRAYPKMLEEGPPDLLKKLVA